MTATERFKQLLANALERVCMLEAALEVAQARVAELETDAAGDAAADENRPADPPLLSEALKRGASLG
jgi:hypothetical protein